MNLLMVDDEIFAIQGILDSLDWEQFNFTNILTANSYAQALNIFVKYRIDIIVCDIEMPYKSGIDLVRWVNENYPDCKSVFLTCHDEFCYAHQALQLKCFEYILKPVRPERLTQVLLSLINVIHYEAEDREIIQRGKDYIHEITSAAEDELYRIKDVEDSLRKVEVYIEENLTEQLTLDKLSRVAYLSTDYLSKLFKTKHKVTVIDYIIDLRIKEAQKLLRNQDMSISKISAKVGYENYSYFTRVFRSRTGMSPREYRRKLNGGNSNQK